MPTLPAPVRAALRSYFSTYAQVNWDAHTCVLRLQLASVRVLPSSTFLTACSSPP